MSIGLWRAVVASGMAARSRWAWWAAHSQHPASRPSSAGGAQQSLDAQVIQQACLGANHVADGDDRKPNLYGCPGRIHAVAAGAVTTACSTLLQMMQ